MRRRGGPGLVGTMARTAVIAGTATAVSKGVSNRMDAGNQQEQAMYQAQQDAMQADANAAAMEAQMAAQQQVIAQQQADLQQAQLAAQQAALAQQQAQQQAAPPPPAAAPPPAAPKPDVISQLQSLAQLRDAGVLTEEEFQQQKARILNG